MHAVGEILSCRTPDIIVTATRSYALYNGTITLQVVHVHDR